MVLALGDWALAVRDCPLAPVRDCLLLVLARLRLLDPIHQQLVHSGVVVVAVAVAVAVAVVVDHYY